jgi:hypothetical protein
VLSDAREQLLNGRSSLAKRPAKGFRHAIREVQAADTPDGGIHPPSEGARRHCANPTSANVDRPDLPAVPPDDRKRQSKGRFLPAKNRVKESRNVGDSELVVGMGQKAVRRVDEAYELQAPQYAPDEHSTTSWRNLESLLDAQDLNWLEYDMQHERGLEPMYDPEHEQGRYPPHPGTSVRPTRRHAAPRGVPVPYTPRHAAPERVSEWCAVALSYGGPARLVVVLVILAGMVAAISWQLSAIPEFYYFLRHSEWKTQSSTSHETRSTRPKLSERVP